MMRVIKNRQPQLQRHIDRLGILCIRLPPHWPHLRHIITQQPVIGMHTAKISPIARQKLNPEKTLRS